MTIGGKLLISLEPMINSLVLGISRDSLTRKASSSVLS